MSKNTAEKFSITLNPEIASYLKRKAKLLKAPISNVVAFALSSQKNKELNTKRKEKLIKAYKQITENYDSDDFEEFKNAQWELSKEID